MIEGLVESINKLTYEDEIDSFIKRSIEKQFNIELKRDGKTLRGLRVINKSIFGLDNYM